MQGKNVVVAVGTLVVLAMATACGGESTGAGSADESTGSGWPVTVVAGGGGTEVGPTPTPAADVSLAGKVTNVTEGPDGGIWGIIDGTGVMQVADGDAQVVTPTLPDGAKALSDVAAAPDGTVYVTVDSPAAGDPAIYELGGDGGLTPGFAVVGTEDELAAAAPVSPDGTAAESAVVGPVTDVAVGTDGSVTFVEQVVPGGLSAVNLIRRIEDGVLHTVAGGSPTAGETPSDEDVVAAAFTGAASASELPVLGIAAIAVDGPNTYIQMVNALVRVDEGGNMTRLVGSRDTGADTLPRSRGPFGESLSGDDVDYRASLKSSPSAADGRVLAMAIGAELTDDQVESFQWRVEGEGDQGAERASASSTAAEQEVSLLVQADGTTTIAGLIGTGAVLTGDGHIVAAGWDADAGRAILVRYPAGA